MELLNLVVNDVKLGLKFNGIEITTVHDGQWASKTGILPGDEIVKVNAGVSMEILIMMAYVTESMMTIIVWIVSLLYCSQMAL